MAMAAEPRHVRLARTDAIADAYFWRHIGQMRTSLALLALMMTSGCEGADAISKAGSEQQVVASAPAASSAVPPDIANAVADWSKCRATKMVVLARTPRSDEAVVDDAFSECIAFERATEALWKKHYGPNSVAQVQVLRSRWREGSIANVRQLRAGAPLTSDDPSKAWGICVGRQIPKPIPADASPDSIVDTALKACSVEMQKVQAAVTLKYGAAEAAAFAEQLRQQARRLIIQKVIEGRPSSH
jgi:hypothetical protein